MSAELMQKAFEISASDPKLTPVDKLVLLRWAWRTVDPSRPYEIRFKTVARELGLSRNAVKASVARLIAQGYLMAVAVKVVAGQAFQTREGGQPVTPRRERQGGQPVTPGGSVSDPQRGQSVTPIKKKKEKRRAKGDDKALAKPRRSLHECSGGAWPASVELSAFQRAQIAKGGSVLVDGAVLVATDARYAQLVAKLRTERVQ